MNAQPTPQASRLTLWLPLVFFAGFVALVLFAMLRPASRDVKSAMVGKPMPAFNLRAAIPELPGLSRADLADGKPKLLNIFASWCVPCAAEAPQLRMLRAQGVDVVGIAIRDRPEDLKLFLQRNGNPYSRIGADDVSKVQFEIGSSGVPESFVIDGKGVIRYQHIGDIRADQVESIVQLVREAGQ